MTEVTINGNTVIRDASLSHRWYDAFGPDVCKHLEDFVCTPFSAADQMAAWLATLIEISGNSTLAHVAGSAGGEIVLTGGGNDNDGVNAQLLGEAFYLASRYPTYFGAKFKVADADQTDVMIGLCIGDTTLLAGTTDGLYFRLVDESTTLSLVAEKDEGETVVGLATLADSTYVIAEFLYSAGVVTAYINGAEVGQIRDSDPNFPDDEYLTPSIAMLNGAASGKTLTVDWIRTIQIQAA